MVLDALLGGVLGGVARLAPEVLKFMDRKGDRAHELALGAQQLDLIKVQGSTNLAQAQVTNDAAQIIAGVQAIQAAQATQKTGFKLADSISALVRPYVTAVLINTWLAVKFAAYVTLINKGIEWNVAVQTLWTNDDVAMLAGVMNFWFLSRVFEKRA